MNASTPWFAELLPSRYSVLRTFALSARRATVLVHDRQSGGERVLKLRRRGDQDAWAELSDEYERLLNLSHPRLVRPLEVDYMAGGAVMALAIEYVPGVNGRTLVGRLSPLQALRIGRAAAEGLIFLHRRRVWHGDIKPENLLVPLPEIDGDGESFVDAAIAELKIADFGLSMVADRDQVRGGTPGFIAPEIARGGPYDARSEIFELGAALWELLCGTRILDDAHDDPLAAALRFRPVPPSRINPSLTPQIDALVLKTIAIDPSMRLQSAGEMLEALDGLIAELGGRHPARGALELLVGPWVDRPGVRSELEEALIDDDVVLLTGAQEAGKTVLCDWLSRSLRLAGRTVLRLHAAASDNGLEPFRRLVGLESTPAADAGTVPSLGDEGFDADTVQSQVEAAQAEVDDSLLEQVADRLGRGTVLIADHADRLPVAARLLLRRLITERRYGEGRVVVPARPQIAADPHHPVLFEHEPNVRSIEVPELTEAELAAALTGDFEEREHRVELVAWLKRRAASLPGRVAALLDQAVEGGAIIRRPGGFAIDRRMLEGLPLLPDAGAGARRVIESLAPDARRVVEGLAILGGHASRRELMAVLGLPADVLADALLELFVLRHAKIDVDGSSVLFGPGLQAAAIEALIEPAAAGALHERAARIVDDPLERFRHQRRAGLEAEAARSAVDLARRATARRDFEEAAGFYDEVLRLVDALPAEERVAVLDEAATVAVSSSNGLLLVRSGKLMLETLPRGAHRARTATHLAHVLLRRGSRDEADRLLGEARGIADELGDERLRARIHLEQAWSSVLQNDDQLAHTHIDSAIATARKLGDSLIERQAYNLTGATHQQRQRFADAEVAYHAALAIAAREGDTRLELFARINLARLQSMREGGEQSAAELNRLVDESRRSGHLGATAQIIGFVAFAHLARGEWDAAKKLLDEGLTVARRRRRLRDEFAYLWGLAYLERQAGLLPRARLLYRQAIEMARGVRDYRQECMMLGNLAKVEALLGEPDEAHRLATRAIEVNTAHRGEGWDASARATKAVLLAEEGDYERARALLAPTLMRARRSGSRNVDMLYRLLDAARIEIRAGDLKAAHELQHEIEQLAAHLETPFARAPALQLEALLSCLQNPEADIGAVYASTVGEYERARVGVDQWLMHLEIGELLMARARERGDRSLLQQAAGHLERAHDGLAIAGAPTDRAQELMLQVFGQLRDLGDGFATSARALLDRMYDVLGSLRDLDQLLENTLKLVIEVVGADRGVLVLRNRRTGRYEVVAARGMQKRAQIKALAVSRTVIRDVVRSGAPIAAEDVELDLKLRDVESIQLHRIGGLACTPLAAGDNVLGALYVDCLGRGVSFLPGTKSLLNSISACVAVAIQNAWTQLDQAQANARLRDRNLELARAAGVVEARYELVGSSRPMQVLRDQTRSVADTDSSVLIVGASGTGKELVTRAIHAWSSRSHHPFVAAVLATIPESLVASTLFGIEKAKATGVEKSLGLFETVGEGVLFLDEITDVGRDVQTALLRVIEQREFSRIGSEGKSLPFRGRLVFATNRDPERAIRDGLLREDLYFRIAAFVIETPSLSEHRPDIPELIEHFRGQYRERYGRSAVPPSFEFIEACLRDPWPGNVRELKHVVERAETTARDPEDWVRVYREHVSRRPGAVPALRSVSYAERLREFERNELTRALRSSEWNQAAAARLLAMPEATLRYKVKTLGIEISDREHIGRQSG